MNITNYKTEWRNDNAGTNSSSQYVFVKDYDASGNIYDPSHGEPPIAYIQHFKKGDIINKSDDSKYFPADKVLFNLPQLLFSVKGIDFKIDRAFIIPSGLLSKATQSDINKNQTPKIVDEKYEVLHDIYLPFGKMKSNDVPPKILLFKKGEIVNGKNSGTNIAIWKEKPTGNEPGRFFNAVTNDDVRLMSATNAEVAENYPLQNPSSNSSSVGTTSGIGNIVTSTTSKIVSGILLVALILGLLKWRKFI